jgi:predicted DNA-binding transcriptional regulator AlpA
MADEQQQYGPLNILSQAQVARVLGVGISSVQRMRRTGDFPPRRSFGGLKGWLYTDIEKWATSRPVEDAEDELEEAS